MKIEECQFCLPDEGIEGSNEPELVSTGGILFMRCPVCGVKTRFFKNEIAVVVEWNILNNMYESFKMEQELTDARCSL